MLGCEHLPEAEPLVNIKPNLSALFYLRACIGGGGGGSVFVFHINRLERTLH